ncbi:MAG TPA: hypothetical protein V6C72_17370 [Chroococcales cyanobacterium]
MDPNTALSELVDDLQRKLDDVERSYFSCREHNVALSHQLRLEISSASSFVGVLQKRSDLSEADRLLAFEKVAGHLARALSLVAELLKANVHSEFDDE